MHLVLKKVVKLNNVVVGMVKSEASRSTLRWAVENTDGNVHAVQVISPPFELLEASFQIDNTERLESVRQQLCDDCDDGSVSNRGSCRELSRIV
ncbi:MAG: hypothetical protein ACJAR2_002389 [Ilumatobacter sp.]